MNAINMPNMPNVAANTMIGNRKMRSAMAELYWGTAKEAIPLRATVITMIGDAMPALMAPSHNKRSYNTDS